MAGAKKSAKELNETATSIRTSILKSLNAARSGHTGGSLSCVDILTTLFFSVMRHDPANPSWEERDRFILSKGHAAPALYATLAEAGYLPKEELSTLRKLGSRLQGHPDRKSLPFLEASTGSLGQGLSIATGIALGLKLKGSTSRVYALLGDGEIQEGMIWEAAMSAAHYEADNLCAVVDNNGLQIDGCVKDVMDVEPIAEKWRAFGWHTMEVDGHNIADLAKAFKRAEELKDKPAMIVAKTIKGKGASFCENKFQYHGVPPSDEELACALKELGK